MRVDLNAPLTILRAVIRVGSAGVPQTLFGDLAASRTLWQELVQRKSFVTVNTSQITQALVGGILLDQNFSLRRWIEPVVDWYRFNRDAMLSGLQAVFAPLRGQVSWNHPTGGFFLTLDLHFEFDAHAMREYASDYGVIVMPMAFFALDSSQNKRIRLAFSSVNPQQIHDGVKALGHYVACRMDGLLRE